VIIAKTTWLKDDFADRLPCRFKPATFSASDKPANVFIEAGLITVGRLVVSNGFPPEFAICNCGTKKLSGK
jgi:hypothetical protein